MILAWMLVVLGVSTLVHFVDTGRINVLVVLFQQAFRGLTSFSFLVVPMFMLAGNLMTKSGKTID